ncbi:MAG: hypothetical protein ABEJ76_09855 [Halanaeroarchaeum sp.]
MDRPTRRRVLRAGVVGAVGAVAPFGGVATAATTETDTASLAREEVRYVGKHASIRALAYAKFAKRFGLSRSHLETQFEEGLPFTPTQGIDSISLQDIGTAAVDVATRGKLGDVATVAWYAETFEMSGIKRVYNRGVDTGLGTPRGIGGAAARAAESENRGLLDRARTVADAAESTLDDPSPGGREGLLRALKRERRAIESETRWIRDWAEIDPNEYPTTDAAETVRKIARLNVDLLEKFADRLRAHEAALTASDQSLAIPRFVWLYRRNADRFVSKVPAAIRGTLFDASVNLYLFADEVERNPEDSRRAINVVVGPAGAIEHYDLVPAPDAGVHVYTTRNVLRRAANSPRPVLTLRRAKNDGRIVVDGKGIGNDVKYEVAPSVVETIEDVYEGVTSAIDDWL